MPLDRAKTTQNAEKHLRAGKIPEAIAEYKKLVEDNPRDMNTINKLGDLCVRAGKPQDAIRYFLRIAEFYAADGFFLKAIAMYKKVSKLDPANMDCFQKLAGLYQQQGLTIEAKAQYLAVADHFVKAGQFKKAIEVMPKVLELEPDNIKVRMTLADLLARTGSARDAAREYCQVARDLAAKGMFDEAIQVTQKGMKASPGDPDIMSLMLSLSKEAQKKPGELLAAVEKMARANGDNPRSQALLGEAYLSAGRSADADKVFKRLQGLGEGAPPEVAAALGRYHIARAAADQALEWLGRVAERWGDGPRAGEAAGLLDEFLRAFPDHRAGLARRAALAEGSGDTKAQAAALRRLAQTLVAAGEIATAIEVLERLAAVEPDNPQHAEMIRSLKARAGGAAPGARAPATPAARPAPPPAPRPATPEPSEDEPIIETTSGESLLGSRPGRPAPPPDPGVELSLEDAAEEAPASGDLSAGDEEYGPQSRIQEIQAAEEEGEEEDDEFVIEHFTEAEVFIKYGLFEKAKQQLLKILAKHPEHVATHAKLKEIYYEEGDKEKAVGECLTLAGIMKSRGRTEEAQDLVNEAIRIDPNNPRIKAFGAPAASPAPAAPAKAPAAAKPAAPPAAPRPPAAAPAKPAVRAPAAPARPPTAPRPAPAAPELELEEVGGGAGIEIEAGGEAASGMEIEIDMPEEAPAPPKPAAKTPAPPARPPAAARGPAAPPASKPRPEKVEEETPDDLLAGLSLGEDGEIAIEVEGETAPTGAAAGRAAAMARDPDPEKLGEVDFYIDQGLLEEARAVLFQLQKQYPDSKQVAQRFERANRPSEVAPPRPAAAPAEPAGLDLDIERAFSAPAGKAPAAAPAAGRASAAPRAAKATPVFKVETAAEAEGDFFDLAGELDRSLAEAQVAVGTQEQEPIEGPGHSLDEIFRAFKRGVEQQVDSEDYDTHYNLGIAYKEMGLVDEAIGEFQYAAKDPARTVECCEILGLCFRDKGMPQLALKWYQKALGMPGLGEQQATGLRYDIAEVYREQGDYRKALQLYTEVYGHDSTYRDVAAKIKEMRKLLP